MIDSLDRLREALRTPFARAEVEAQASEMRRSAETMSTKLRALSAYKAWSEGRWAAVDLARPLADLKTACATSSAECRTVAGIIGEMYSGDDAVKLQAAARERVDALAKLGALTTPGLRTAVDGYTKAFREMIQIVGEDATRRAALVKDQEDVRAAADRLDAATQKVKSLCPKQSATLTAR